MLNFEWEKIGEKKYRMSDGELRMAGKRAFRMSDGGCRIFGIGEMSNVEPWNEEGLWNDEGKRKI